jgi:manganese transport protein
MLIGWAINSAMILLAAATFFRHGTKVSELEQAHEMLQPLLGNNAAVIFAVALLFSGIASSITSGMAGGSIFAGLFGEPYDIKDYHSGLGVAVSLILALLIIFAISDPFMGLIYSQMILSIQLPITVFLQIYLTSSKKVMKNYANGKLFNISLLIIGGILTVLNVMLLISFLK